MRERGELSGGNCPGGDLPRTGQNTCWDFMRKTAQPDINLGPRYYAYCDLNWYGKFSNAASLLWDINDSDW